MRWIDTHTHIFSKENAPLVGKDGSIHTCQYYLESFGDKKPEIIISVDYSKAKDSENVVESLDEFKKMNVNALGVIRAGTDKKTLEWLKRDDVKAIRFYCLAGVPDLSPYGEIFDIIRTNNKHVLVFGVGDNLIQFIKKFPKDITLLVDHLGLAHTKEVEQNLDTILKTIHGRKNIHFKGPGYRTNLDSKVVKNIVKKIIDNVGEDHFILGASDAPFVGQVPEFDQKNSGKNYSDVMDSSRIVSFMQEVSQGFNAEKLLYSNAKKLYSRS